MPHVPRLLFLSLLLYRPLTAGTAFLWEGFERENFWYASDAATGRQVSADYASEGTHSLKLPFKTVATAGRAIYARYEVADWSPYGSLLLDIYNPTQIQGFKSSVLIYSTSRWVAHEYYLPPLAPGWNRDLKVDLRSSKFSTPASGYQPTGYLVGRGEVQGLAVILQPGQAVEGEVYLDNIRLERSSLVSVGDFSLNTTLEAVGSAGDLSYLPPRMRLRGEDFRSLESFEDPAIPWSSPDPGVVLEQCSDLASQGVHALSLRFPERPDGFSVDMNGLEGRLSGSRQLRLDIYNPGMETSFSLWLTDNDGNYYSSYKTLAHGWNTPIFDFSRQSDWSGAVIDNKVLSNLGAVGLTVYSTYPGRLVIDGVASSSIYLRGASKLGILASLSYNPSEDFELIADARAEDTYYGPELSGTRDAGAEAYLDAAGLRWDRGEFRNQLLYRRRVKAFDNPITPLLQTEKLGNEITAWEMGGRVGETQLQALAASRLEYGRYNSHLPTGLGPEAVAGIRGRRKLWGDTRLGLSAVTHQNRYGGGVEKLPAQRQTLGADLDGRWAAGEASLSWAAEGAQTGGDLFQNSQLLYAPLNDRSYLGAQLSPSWKRLSVSYYYALLGYDFDAELTKYGGNSEWHGLDASFTLEDLGPLARLREVPLYDRSLGNNLHVSFESFVLSTRSRYLDSRSGQLLPAGQEGTAQLSLANEDKAKPHFRLEGELEHNDSQWNAGERRKLSLSLKLPLASSLSLDLKASRFRNDEWDKGSWQSGYTEGESAEGGLEWAGEGNLLLNVSVNGSGGLKNWEGTAGSYETHVKWIAALQKNLGPDSLLRLDWGQPALLEKDYGLQDSVEVLTLTLKIYL